MLRDGSITFKQQNDRYDGNVVINTPFMYYVLPFISPLKERETKLLVRVSFNWIPTFLERYEIHFQSHAAKSLRQARSTAGPAGCRRQKIDGLGIFQASD